MAVPPLGFRESKEYWGTNVLKSLLPRRKPLPATPDPADLVRLAFRVVLHREVDPEGLATYLRLLGEGRDLLWIVESLTDSQEYRTLNEPPPPVLPYPLDSAPPMHIEAATEPAALQALWDHVAATWSTLGETDAHWSVLTEDRYRAEALDGAALADFLAAGEGEVHRLDAWLRRSGMALPAEGTCIELGCGVGRITRSLARRFTRVVALDVSASHLRAAAAQMAAEGIGNVELAQIRGQADLIELEGADLFFSVISLQHSPPPIILDVLARAFAGLRPGGFAFFQVPTYALDYDYPKPAASPGTMEMHFVPQHAVFALAHRAGLRPLEVQPDWCVGRPGEWISNTFLFVKDAQPNP